VFGEKQKYTGWKETDPVENGPRKKTPSDKKKVTGVGANGKKQAPGGWVMRSELVAGTTSTRKKM